MSAPPPDALLVTAPGCPHCPLVLAGLDRLRQEGLLGRLTLLDAAAQPDRAARLGVKSVPWLRLGPFVLEGVQSPAELRRWTEAVHAPTGMATYFDHLLASGRRQLVERLVRAEPDRLTAFVQLLGDPEVGLNTRLGVGVVLEELRGSGLATHLTDALGTLTRHPDARIRGDACYYLPLCDGLAAAAPFLRERLRDDHPEVREIATEALAELDNETAPYR